MANAYGTPSAEKPWDDYEREDQKEEEELEGLEGREKANEIFEKQLAASKTLGELQSNVSAQARDVLQEDPEAEQQMRKIETGVDTVAQGHGHTKIDASLEGSAVLGYNNGLSHNTAVSSVLLHAEQIANDTDHAHEVVEHEDSEKVGHAGQVEVQDLVGKDGDTVEATVVLEGNVEQQVADSGFGRRDDQPQAVYGEGDAFVRDIGAEDVNAYARKGGAHAGDRVWMQAKIFEQSSLDAEEMRMALEKNNYADPEVDEIVKRARGRLSGLGELEEAKKEEMAMAA